MGEYEYGANNDETPVRLHSFLVLQNTLKSVIVVDDDRSVLRALSRMLVRNYRVRSAESFEEAVALIEAEAPDVVVSDLWMPNETGFTLIETVNKRFPRVPIIIISGKRDQAAVQAAIELGASSFLEKPFSENELSTEIARALKTEARMGKSTNHLSQFDVPQLGTKLRLDVNNVSIDDLHQLYALSTASLAGLRHELGNPLAAIAAWSDQLRYVSIKRLEESISKPLSPPSFYAFLQTEIARLREVDTEIRDCVSRAATLLKRYTSGFRSTDLKSAFVTNPSVIVSTIATEYPFPVKQMGDTSLEILFPNRILFSFISEFITNIKKHSGNAKPEVLIKWCMSGASFECQVHDNGKGFPLTHKGMFPYDLLVEQLRNDASYGLGILNRIALDASGMLLFGKSPPLGGGLVMLKVPVATYYSDNAGVQHS
ncbi:MAG TPA: response regulator [Chthoniobacterales bacterium]|nr:response regulator [Chthoniobacterales bacterium]